LCNELDKLYKYVKENKGDKKYICQYALILVKKIQYLFVHQKDRPQKPPANAKRIWEEM
jgi:hypothetical protein